MDRTEASEQVAAKFTRMMNATTSRYGLLSDVGSASILSGAVLVVGLIALGRSADPTWRTIILVIALLPILASVVAARAFSGAREKVVSWLAALPFPVDNFNAILAGTGDTVEVVFARAMPERSAIEPGLDRLSEEILILGER
ncbi:MAG TPA: hypothetical protein VGL13_18250, partial [Polyangiaceae bacterium]